MQPVDTKEDDGVRRDGVSSTKESRRDGEMWYGRWVTEKKWRVLGQPKKYGVLSVNHPQY